MAMTPEALVEHQIGSGTTDFKSDGDGGRQRPRALCLHAGFVAPTL